jgi:hypothetical protein
MLLPWKLWLYSRQGWISQWLSSMLWRYASPEKGNGWFPRTSSSRQAWLVEQTVWLLIGRGEAERPSHKQEQPPQMLGTHETKSQASLSHTMWRGFHTQGSPCGQKSQRNILHREDERENHDPPTAWSSDWLSEHTPTTQTRDLSTAHLIKYRLRIMNSCNYVISMLLLLNVCTILCPSFYRWGNWEQEKLRHSPEEHRGHGGEKAKNKDHLLLGSSNLRIPLKARKTFTKQPHSAILKELLWPLGNLPTSQILFLLPFSASSLFSLGPVASGPNCILWPLSCPL